MRSALTTVPKLLSSNDGSRGGAANFLLGGPSSNLKEAFFVWNSYIYHRGVASFFSEGEGQKIISQFIFG